MEDQDLIISPEDALLARRKRRIIVIGSVVLVLAILFGVFCRRPAGHAIRAWQARRHAQKAFAFINKEQWDDARSEAMAAYQLSPDQPEALRAVARYLTRLHSIEALDFWKELSRKTSLTRPDVRDEAMIAIIAGDVALADTAVDELIDSHAEPADWLLAAQLAMQKNLPDEEKSYLAKIVADSRATVSEQFRATLLQLSLAANSPSERANALTRLGKLAEGKTATSLDALVVVAQNALSTPADSSDSTRNEAGRLASALENHPLAKAKHELLAFDLRIHADPTQREQLITRAIADWKDSDPADRLDLAVWLNSKGEFQRAIDSIPLEKSMQSGDLFLRHLDALGGLGRWKEVEQQLRSGKFPLDPFLEAMYLARCNSQLGEQTASANNWQRALEAAQGDARKLITLAQYAEQNKETEIAEVAFNNAAAITPRLRLAWDGRLRLAQASRDTKKIHAVLANMLLLWPDDLAIQNDEAYTRLLLCPPAAPETKSQAAAIEKLAEKLIDREPRSLPHRTLLALALLRQERAEDALRVYSQLQVKQDEVSGSALAVHAAILAATANLENAKTEAAQLKREQLLPEEQALVGSLPGS
jgi:cytochrome c-type biogenesis protein CcmH/NrfG